jgi:glyoxylase-like metal-dependent hydrolase (beta-lactamase superfamily II)
MMPFSAAGGLHLHPSAPELAGNLELASGIRWLRLPLPFQLDHVNVWLIGEPDGWTLVDTGIDAAVTREAWRTLFRTALEGRPLRRVIVTHYHPDHMGLARFLWEEFRPEFVMTGETEARARFLLKGAEPELIEDIAAFCRAHAIDRVGQYTDYVTGAGYRKMVSGLPGDITCIDEVTTLLIGGRAWRPIIANGHAPGHMSLYCEELGLLIAGDQILPNITCNISVQATNRDEDALDAYLESMHRFTDLPEDTVVLPAHGRVFSGLHARIDAITAHHRASLDKVLAICAAPRCLTKVAPRMFRRKLEGLNYFLGLGEALSHLVYLHNRDEVVVETVDGVQRFARR